RHPASTLAPPVRNREMLARRERFRVSTPARSIGCATHRGRHGALPHRPRAQPGFVVPRQAVALARPAPDGGQPVPTLRRKGVRLGSPSPRRVFRGRLEGRRLPSPARAVVTATNRALFGGNFPLGCASRNPVAPDRVGVPLPRAPAASRAIAFS